jgi:hypothetical protein
MPKTASKLIPTGTKVARRKTAAVVRPFAIVVFLMASAAVPAIAQQGNAPPRPNVTPPLTLTTPAFSDGGTIPVKILLRGDDTAARRTSACFSGRVAATPMVQCASGNR